MSRLLARITLGAMLAATVNAAATVRADEPPADRRQRIESMTPAEKEQLRKQQQRLEEMPADEQARLRQLDERLAADSRADELRRVMLAYYDWLKVQHPAVREELRGLAPEARVARVKQLRDEERKRAALWLSPEDIEVVRDWLHDLVIAKFTPEERAEFDKAPHDRRWKMLSDKGWAIAREGGVERRFGPDNPPHYSAEEMEVLRDKLSAKAQSALDDRPRPIDKRKLIWLWSYQTMGGPTPNRGQRPWLVVDQQTLLRFYQEQLTDEQRMEVDLLPTDQKLFELQKRYYRKKSSNGPPRMRQPGGQDHPKLRPRNKFPVEDDPPPA
jgi:hypothetical protein